MTAKGQQWEWSGIPFTITRVAKDGRWADIQVRPRIGTGWTKRQPLPFPDTFRKLP